MRKLSALILAAVVACTSGQGEEPVPPVSSPGSTETAISPTSSPTTTAPTTTTSPPATTNASSGDTVPPGPVEDGRFFGHLQEVRQENGRTVLVIDYAEFLTGDEAAAAAAEAGDESPPPNGFYIRNLNPRLRELTVDSSAEVTLTACYPQGECVTMVTVDLPQWLDLLAGDLDAVEFEWYGAGLLPYWIDIEDGRVAAIEEQYLP